MTVSRKLSRTVLISVIFSIVIYKCINFTVKELNLKNILNATKGVKWYELGVQLDFEASCLEIINEDHPNNAERAKIKLISEWSKNDREASWDKLAAALRQMGHQNLSDAIAQEYGQGIWCIIVLTYTIRFEWMHDAYVKFEYNITIKITIWLCQNKI